MPIDTEFWARIEAEQAEAKADAVAQFKTLLTANPGLISVEIEFSGYGDSGSINTTPEHPHLHETLENIAYQFLDGTGIDWYNGDGGCGHINLTNNPPSLEYEVNQYVTETNLAASGELAL